MVSVVGSGSAAGAGAGLLDVAGRGADVTGFEELPVRLASAAGAAVPAQPASTAAASPRATARGVRMMRRV
jgi:hypothetical protein